MDQTTLDEGGLMMKPLKRMSLKDVVIQKLQQYMTEHQLQPGDRFLNEKEMIQLTGVSRTVVREAIKALEAVGVLHVKPGDGIFVSEASVEHLVNQFSLRWLRDPSRMEELLETRTMLELAALEIIIGNADSAKLAAGIQQLEANMAQMRAAIERKQSIIGLDVEFHRLLFKLTGNQTFYELSEVIVQFFDEVRKSRLSAPEGYGGTVNDHAEIVRCLQERQLDKAKEAMIRHISPLQKIIEQGKY
ncbi:FadR/GntR family transcriptional regulator [Paenibacillus sp. GCM10027626]|uniref:FadR/GntR family transcriptional regulator n=1 Tax=Paenibacillus sp. GCM10027626 TaxID=3273411 RepID=UPI003627B3DA